MKRAAFLDRDGTIIREADYLADPDGVELLPGAAEALRELRAAGFGLVVVTNQSGIARGLYTQQDFHAVQRHVEALLAAHGVVLDGVYHCPHHPEFSGPCDCRKPQAGLFRRAAAELGIDTAASIFVGDRVRDVLPAIQLGGRGFLVETGYGAGEAANVPAGVRVLPDLRAVARFVAAEGRSGTVDTAGGLQ